MPHQNSMEEVSAITQKVDIPNMTSKNITILRTDSAELSYKLMAPILERYTNVEKPYVVFREGIIAYGYDGRKNVETSITANYAKHFEEDDLVIAENDVVAINVREGNTLNTEYLVWDRKKEIIFSDKFCRISTPDGVYYGKNGFEADQSFSKWTLKQTKGEIKLKDDE